MFSWIARLLLTSTAIAPVLMTYGWVAFTEGDHRAAVVLGVICIGLVMICLGMLIYANSKLERMPFSADTIEAADRENMAFLLLYILPLFTSKFVSLDWQVWLPTLVVFAVITATGYNYHFNPLIGLFKWHFYKVQSKEGVTYVLITKKQIRTAAAKLKVGQLTEYILLDIPEG